MFRNDYSQKSQKQQLVTIFHHVQRCFQAQVSTTLDEAHLFLQMLHEPEKTHAASFPLIH